MLSINRVICSAALITSCALFAADSADAADGWQWGGDGGSGAPDTLQNGDSTDWLDWSESFYGTVSSYSSGTSVTWSGSLSADANVSCNDWWDGEFQYGATVSAGGSMYGELYATYGPVLEDDEPYIGPTSANVSVNCNLSGHVQTSTRWGQSWWWEFETGGDTLWVNIGAGASASASSQPGSVGGVTTQGGSTNAVSGGTVSQNGVGIDSYNAEVVSGTFQEEWFSEASEWSGWDSEIAFTIQYSDNYVMSCGAGSFYVSPTLSVGATADMFLWTQASNWERVNCWAWASADIAGDFTYTIQ